MSTQDSQQLATLLHQQFGLVDLPPHLIRLLAEGRPVSVERLAEATGHSVSDVRAELARHPSLDWNDRGELVGFGLTLRPTEHRFSFDGRTVYAFCASDTFLFPALIGRAGVIESICPATSRPIRVQAGPDAVTAVEPADAVVSRIRPDHAVADFRTEICALGNFFASKEAASEWLEAHPEGAVVSIAEDFATTLEGAKLAGWLPASG